MSRRTSEQGFTLVELMVAMTAGLVAILAAYYISSASSKHFHEQQRVASAQMSLRMAIERLRRDFSRVSYLSTPNSRVEVGACLPRVPAMQAVFFQDNQATTAMPFRAENGVSGDRIRLTGNYVTSDAYHVRGNDVNSLTLQTEWQSFVRDFGQWDQATLTAAAPPLNYPTDVLLFNETFRNGRVLSVMSRDGMRFYLDINGQDGASSRINFVQPLNNAVCGGTLAGATAAPISTVEYIIANPDGLGDLSQLRSSATPAVQAATGTTNAVLVRRELNVATAALIPGTTEVILENVADFNLEFIFDDAVNPTDPPNLVRRTGAQSAGLLGNNAANAAHRLRSVIIRLSVRTSAEDPNFPWTPRVNGDPLTRYDVNGDGEGRPAARVRTFETEVFLPNIAERNLRP